MTLLCRNPHSRLQGVKWGQRPRSPLLDTQPVRGRRSLNPNPGQCIHLILSPCRTLRPHGLLTARLLCSWDLPGKNTGVGCHFLLQRTCLTQGSNPHLLSLLHGQVDSLPLHNLGSIYTGIMDSLCCTPETNTTLESNYTSI